MRSAISALVIHGFLSTSSVGATGQSAVRRAISSESGAGAGRQRRLAGARSWRATSRGEWPAPGRRQRPSSRRRRGSTRTHYAAVDVAEGDYPDAIILAHPDGEAVSSGSTVLPHLEHLRPGGVDDLGNIDQVCAYLRGQLDVGWVGADLDDAFDRDARVAEGESEDHLPAYLFPGLSTQRVERSDQVDDGADRSAGQFAVAAR